MPKKRQSADMTPAFEDPTVVDHHLEGRFKFKSSQIPGADGELRLSARQFVRARGIRWERAAAFLHEMKKHGPEARKTIREWAPLWDAFWSRPVR